MRQKVLLIMPISTRKWGSKSVGGVDSVCQMLVKYLTESTREYHYHVLAFDPSNSIHNEGVAERLSDSVEISFYNISNGKKFPNIISQYRIVSKLVNSFRPDIVHSHLLSWSINHYIKSPSITTLHGYKKISRKRQGKLNNLVFETIIPILANRLVDRVTCVTDTFSKAVSESLHLPIDTVYNPIEDRYFSGSNRILHDSTSLNLVTCALLTPRKGIHHILSVMDLMKRHNLDVNLTVIGPSSSESYVAFLKSIISKYGLENNVNFVGQKKTKEIIDIYNTSDIGIFLSEEETFGLAPLEMLAVGLPVIASNTGIMSDFFKRNLSFNNLKIVQFGDHEEIAKLIRDFSINDYSFDNEEPSKVKIEDLFSVKNILLSYEGIYKSIPQRGDI